MKKTMTLARGVYWLVNVLWVLVCIVCVVVPAGLLVAYLAFPSVSAFVSESLGAQMMNQFSHHTYLIVVNSPGAILHQPSDHNTILMVYFVFSLLMMPLAVYIAYQMKQLFKNFSNSFYFTLENAQRVARDAYASILNVLVTFLYTISLSQFYPKEVDLGSFGRALQMPVFVGITQNSKPLLYSLFVLVLAKIFQEGLRLKQDQDLTV
jgi:hypothetical protein